MIGGDASSSNPRPSSALLAPGFRFHPTDEELVGYYLKRKVSGRSIRVDAIAEVDLYKFEPWDLPSKSRLRSRDMEWYFFTPLDRKYSNRSRTNRATVGGYWKTTGNDRPVRHGSRKVGIKKTLVFHVGRAPGERTNWVMHEYRLENEARISQDAFVVCRIFQKCGSGPQNGAQYGAPFIEEEWEEADDELVPVGDAGLHAFVDAGNQEYMQLNDFEQNQDLGSQAERTDPLTAGSDEQDGGNHPEDPTVLLDDILKDQSFVDEMDGYYSASGLQGSPTLSNDVENAGIAEQSRSLPDQSDGYVELNDIFDNATENPCADPVEYPLRASHDQYLANGANQTINLQEVDDVEFFDTTNVVADSSELVQMCQPVECDFNLELDELLNLVDGNCPTDQPSEDNVVFHDAPDHDILFTQGDVPHTEELPFSPVADLSGFDMMDNLMAYFDATDNNLHYATLNSSEKQESVYSSTMAQSTPEVDGIGDSAVTVIPQAPEANTEMGTSSRRLSEADNKLKGINQEVSAVQDVQSNDGLDKTLRKRLVNMLGSISAPPAFASELPPGKAKSVGQISATRSSSSIHVTAGMIQIHGLTVTGSEEHWTLQKNGGMSFLLSYGMADDVVSKSVCYEPITKLHGGSMSMLFRGGFYLLCFSMLILTVSIKVGMHVYDR